MHALTHVSHVEVIILITKQNKEDEDDEEENLALLASFPSPLRYLSHICCMWDMIRFVMNTHNYIS